ncbi:MAG: hypothetical protein QHC90_07540 [Shinella sp.]|nr:hypothetical protein [Shinella sp.]
MIHAVIFGRPFFFFDTWEFYAFGKDIVGAASMPWSWSEPMPERDLWSSRIVFRDSLEENRRLFDLTLSSVRARSEFYAVPLYALNSVWSVAAVQSLLVALLLRAAAVPFGGGRPLRRYLAWVAVLVLTTPLPFVATYLMPDIFSGMVVLLVMMLVLFRRQLSSGVVLALFLLLVYCLNVHTVGPALAATGIVVLGTLCLFLGMGREVRGGLGLAVAAVVVALAINWMSGLWLNRIFDRPVQKPPFLLARVMLDGPGQAYLRDVCPDAGFVSCELAHVPLRNSESFLWPNEGTVEFSPISDPGRRASFYSEQWPIVTEAVLRYPLQQAKASAILSAKQLFKFRVKTDHGLAGQRTLQGDPHPAAVTAAIMPKAEECLSPANENVCGSVYSDKLWRMIDIVNAAAAFLAAAFVLYSGYSFAKGGFGKEMRPALVASFYLLIMVAANAVICGALSGAYDRYQTKAVWMSVLAALIAQAALQRKASSFPASAHRDVPAGA